MSLYLVNTYQTESILFAGGVSASSLIRKNLETKLSKMQIHFGEPALCTDNAQALRSLEERNNGFKTGNCFTTE